MVPEAVDLFDRGHFDVILMDMQMPVMRRYRGHRGDPFARMRRSWVVPVDVRPVYIIAMTANVMASDRDRCIEAGMNDYVAKPLRPDDLYAGSWQGRAVVADRSMASDDGPTSRGTSTRPGFGDARYRRPDLFATMVGMLLSGMGCASRASVCGYRWRPMPIWRACTLIPEELAGDVPCRTCPTPGHGNRAGGTRR